MNESFTVFGSCTGDHQLWVNAEESVATKIYEGHFGVSPHSTCGVCDDRVASVECNVKTHVTLNGRPVPIPLPYSREDAEIVTVYVNHK